MNHKFKIEGSDIIYTYLSTVRRQNAFYIFGYDNNGNVAFSATSQIKFIVYRK